MNNSDERFINGCGKIGIILESDSETAPNARCDNIDYLMEIFRSPKLQNYHTAEMEVHNVQTGNYDEVFGSCQTISENDVEWKGITFYLDNRFSFTGQVDFKNLKALEMNKCDVTVEDIVAICSFENLSKIEIYESELLENLQINGTNKQILHLNIDDIMIWDSDEILVYLAKNVSMKGNCASFRMPSIATNFTEHLSTPQRPCYFSEQLAVEVDDDDFEVVAESIVSLLALSRYVEFQDRDYMIEQNTMRNIQLSQTAVMILQSN